MPAPTERVFVANPIAAAGGRVIASPFQFWTTGEDHLRIVSANSVTGVTLAIQGRWIESDGTIKAASWTHTPNTDRTTRSEEYPLAIGAVLNLVVFARTGAPLIGQTFVMVQLIRGRGAAAIVLGTLLQGYVTALQGLAWPGSPIMASTDGEPPSRMLTGTAPAVGAHLIETVPTGARWELLGLFHSVTKAAGLNAGRPIYVARASGQDFARIPSQQPTIAGAVTMYLSWLPGYSTPITVTPVVEITTSLSVGYVMPSGTEFGVLQNDVTHQYSAPNYLIREWLEVS